MALLVPSGKYGDKNATDSTTMGYYVIMFVSEYYTLQEETTCGGKISTDGESVVKAKYLIYMREKKKGIGSENSSNKS